MIKEDIRLALDNLKFSRAIYSNFKVSSVLTAKNGKKYTGVNIESASYTPTICAERTAFFKAVSEGVLEFESIVIVGGKNGKVINLTPPCGVCRQVMMDYCDPKTFKIIIAIDEDNYEEYTLEQLLPLGFGAKNLEG
ncbi:MULTISPECIES: cytidine deaminase [Helcococcus]|uniref:Cytidine deaminase n=1 Tax=Helcococcus bovis TaxID=3153252 RepID=A0ABW9F8E6_9FIRM